MSVFRLAIIVSCAVAALPSDKMQQARLYESAASAAHWAGTYCDREPEKCEQAAAFWEQFKSKAQFAAGVAYDAMQRYSTVASNAAAEKPETRIELAVVRRVPLAPAIPAAREIPVVSGRGTLSENDLKAAWRGRKS